jgi:hypothetical protein
MTPLWFPKSPALAWRRAEKGTDMTNSSTRSPRTNKEAVQGYGDSRKDHVVDRRLMRVACAANQVQVDVDGGEAPPRWRGCVERRTRQAGAQQRSQLRGGGGEATESRRQLSGGPEVIRRRLDRKLPPRGHSNGKHAVVGCGCAIDQGGQDSQAANTVG